MAHYDSAAK
jgi:hypothetical protein